MQARRNRTFRLVSTLAALGGAAFVAAHEPPPPGAAHPENYWKPNRLAASERRMLSFVDAIAETDLPLLLMALATFLFTAALAYTLPELVALLLMHARLPERYARGVATMLFLGILGIGTAVSLSVFDLDVGHQILALGLAGIALSYGWGVEISNIAGGIALPLHEPVEVGRTIAIERVTGVVEYVSLRYTRLRVSGADGPPRRVWVPNHYFAQYPCEEIYPAPTRALDFSLGKAE